MIRQPMWAVAAVASAARVLAACTGQTEPESASGGAASVVSGQSDTPSSGGGPSPSSESEAGAAVAPECEPGPGKTITDIPDLQIPAQEIPAVEADDLTIDGRTVPVPGVDAVTIPARVADMGCVIEYDAPGGCLGAVEISGARIPAVTIPERTLPAVELPDGTVLDAVVLPAVTAEEVSVDGVRVEQVCQAEPDSTGDRQAISAVARSAIARSAFSQSAIAQSSAARSSRSVDGTLVPAVYVPSVYVDSTYAESQYVESGYLPSYLLEGTDSVEVSDDDGATTFTTQGDVLFDPDESTVRPDAEQDLRAIAQELSKLDPDTRILVEGHTDDVDTDAHNQALSESRAKAVADWLAANGGIDASRITTTGYGESVPRADNATEEGRQQNRRVVITASSSD